MYQKLLEFFMENNIILTNDQMEEIKIILNEGRDPKSQLPQIPTLYMHMIKFIVEPEIQSTSWVNTIYNNMKNYYEVIKNNKTYKNGKGVSIQDQQNYFYEGAKRAIKETERPEFKERINKFAAGGIPEEFLLENIYANDSKEYMRNFMYKYLNRNNVYIKSIINAIENNN